MGDGRSSHLSDEQLARFQDGELPLSGISHLNTCPECANRLRDLQTASAAYMQYRDSIRGLALPPTPKPWRSLDALISQHISEHNAPISEHALLAEAKTGSRVRALRWWLIPGLAAALCLLIAALMVLRKPAQQISRQASELLTRSARAELPPNRVISIRLRGRTLVRPAVLATTDPRERDPGLAHLQMVFSNAHYSWREPLSAGSFQSWRRGLPNKRDTVSVIHAAGEAQAYRIRTDTSTGILRSVSLTLRGERLRPANGAFQFAGEDPLEIDEASPPPVPDPIRKPPPASRETPMEAAMETQASPADTLHVLAALNEIGADVGEPVSISEDSQHQVIVRAMGLNTDRRQQIADALKPLRHVRLEPGNSPPDVPRPASRPAATEKYSTGIPGPLRQQFEERLGSAVAFQEMTDRVLDASASAVSRAHALEVLANKFPPATESDLAIQDRELLGKLRQRHVSELQRLVTQLRSNLQPLLTTTLHSPATATDNRSLSSWQTQVPALVAAAQELDDSLNRLLAGTYVQASGDAMLRGLAAQLEHLQRVIAQEAGK